MPPKLTYIFFLICLSQSFLVCPSNAQGKNPDSIRNIIQHTKYDSVRVLSLLDYGGLYAYQNADSAFYYYRLAKELAKKINFERGFHKYVTYQTEIYNIQGNFDSSLQLNKEGLAIAIKSSDILYQGTHLSNIGNVFLYQGKNDSAAHYFLQGTQYLEELEDSMKLGILYANLAGVFSNLRQPDRAINYNQQAIRMAEATHDQLGIGYGNVNLGAEYKKLSKYDSAKYYTEIALKIALESKDFNLEKDALVNLGFIEIKLNHILEAEQYLHRSLALSQFLKSDYGIISSKEGLASIAFQEKDYLSSKRYIEEAIQLASKGRFNEELKNLYLLQYETEQLLGNYKQALNAYRLYNTLKDSISNADIQKNIALLEQQYQAGRKENMILQRDLQIKTQNVLLQSKNAWIVIMSLVSVLMLVLFFMVWKYFRQRQIAVRRENELKQIQLSFQVKEDERNRIAGELHDDIGATLSSIHIYSTVAERALQENPEKTKDVLQQINRNSRQVMENMSDIVWAMKQDQAGEKSFSGRIKNYGYDLLTSKNIECHYEIQEKAELLLQNLEARKNILLIVKEAMNNISKYSGARQVLVRMELVSGNMLISINDDGKGFNPVENSIGNGMSNMKRRTEYLGGVFTLLSSTGRGTQVNITIPLTKISDNPIEK